MNLKWLRLLTPSGQNDFWECRRLRDEALAVAKEATKVFWEAQNHYKNDYDRYKPLADRHVELATRYRELTDQWNDTAGRLGVGPIHRACGGEG